MSKIDSSRLIQIFSALATQKNTPISAAPDQVQNVPNQHKIRTSRSTVTLRSRLKTRLLDNRQRNDFFEAAPAIAIQEILCWEFGDEVMDHRDFEWIVQQVTTTILSNIQTAQAMTLLIDEITNEG